MNQTQLNYDSRSIWLHWITATLVVALWCLGETIDWFPKGDVRIAARSVHVCLGVAVGLVLCYRLWWRAGGRGRRLAPSGAGIVQTLATTMHFALYAMLLTTVVLGVANEWERGDSIFNLFKVPSFDPDNKALRGRLEDLHALSANILIWLAGLHALMGLAHHFLWKDGVLRRMLPRRG